MSLRSAKMHTPVKNEASLNVEITQWEMIVRSSLSEKIEQGAEKKTANKSYPFIDQRLGELWLSLLSLPNHLNYLCRIDLVIALFHELKGETGDALQRYDYIISNNNTFWPAYIEKGRLLLQLGRYEESGRVLSHILHHEKDIRRDHTPPEIEVIRCAEKFFNEAKEKYRGGSKYTRFSEGFYQRDFLFFVDRLSIFTDQSDAELNSFRKLLNI